MSTSTAQPAPLSQPTTPGSPATVRSSLVKKLVALVVAALASTVLVAVGPAAAVTSAWAMSTHPGT
jgi:hypothetical protein